MHRMDNHNSTGPWRTNRRHSSLPALVGLVLIAVGLGALDASPAEAQATFRAAASASATTGNLTITKPTGTVEDDVLIASIGVRPNTTGITPPTGWTLVRRVDTTGPDANSLAVYRLKAGASEPASYTWTLTGVSASSGGIQSFTGVDTTTPIDVENGQATASGLTHATPSIVTTFPNTMLVTSHTFASTSTWTPPAGVTEGVDATSGSPGTFEVRVTANSDDAEEKLSNGSMTYISNDLDLIKAGGADQEVGMRFLNVTVPAGATITNAYIQFHASKSDSGVTNLTFRGEAADNPVTFTTTDYDLTTRAKTTASAAWSVPAWTSGTNYQTTDLTAVVQEVVDRGGWASGNAIALYVTGSGSRLADAYDGDAANAPLVHIDYLGSDAGQTTEAGYVLQASAGATGTKTATAAGMADAGNTHLLALRSIPLAALTGTLADGAVEDSIVAGGETLIITLTSDTWDATIGADNAKTTALIAGIDSAQSEGAGWDAVVKANLDYNDVVRTSDSVVTITLGAEATYQLTANETITVTVPATAVTSATELVATPTFAIVAVMPFEFRKSITIDRTKVGTGTAPATLPNYPLLSSVTDADLKSTGNGGDVTSTSGHDILFRALDDTTCGGTGPCTLDHEIESYDPVTGQLVAWVRLPSINTNTAGSDTVLYIFYGNSAIIASIQDAEGVWDADHLMVQHHNEGSGTVTDSTQSDNDSNSQTGMTYGSAGKVGNSFLFDESDDYYTVGDFSYGDTFTLSMWMKVTDNTGSQYQYFYSHDALDTNPSLALYLHEDSVANPDDLEVRLRDSVASIETVLSDVSAGDANVTDAAWHQVTLTRVRNGTNNLYVDSVSQGTSTGPDTAIDPAGSINIGRREDGNVDRYFGGNLDEIRISDVERSADWVKTVYNNTNGPGDIGAADFYTVGTEETSQPLTAVELVAFTATGYDRGVLLSWETGYEIDNLGFHVYREQAGERVQLTASLVAGSGLLVQRGTAVTTAQAYAWWDMAVSIATVGITYWLEDVDFDGTSTWHGPVTPVDGGHLIDVGPPAPGEGVAGPNSGSLDGLATVQGATRQAFLTSDQPSWTQRVVTTGSGTPLEAQWAIAQQPAVKIGVRRTGWFRVTQAALVAGGLDPTVDPRRLQLFVNGVEQAITVSGEADGQFDPADSIGFYGTGVDTAYTDLRVYWVVSGASPGRRITTAVTAPVSSSASGAAAAPTRAAPAERMTPVADAADDPEAAPAPARAAPARAAANPPAAGPPATRARTAAATAAPGPEAPAREDAGTPTTAAPAGHEAPQRHPSGADVRRDAARRDVPAGPAP